MKSIIYLTFFVLFVHLTNGAPASDAIIQDSVWVEGGPSIGGFNKNLTYFSVLEDSQGDLYIFGGYDGVFYGLHFYGFCNQTNDMWKVEVRKNYSISLIETSGSKPAPRADYQAWMDKDDNLWIFGGAAKSWEVTFSDLWKFDTRSRTWSLISEGAQERNSGDIGVGTSSTHPGPRVGSATWIDTEKNILWLFGGTTTKDGNSWPCGDVWTYNIATKIWTWVSGRLSFAEIYRSESAQLKVPSKTAFPATLYSSSAAVDNNGDVWIVGGDMVDFKSSELWRFRPSTLEWTWMSGDGPNKEAVYGDLGEFSDEFTPAGATGGSLIYAGNNMLTYWPGYSYYNYTTDIHKADSFSAIFSYNITAEQWGFTWGNLSDPGAASVHAAFGQSNPDNFPAARQRSRSLTRGNLWIMRGLRGLKMSAMEYSFAQDSFMFPAADPCASDVNQCSVHAQCTSHLGYYDCKCDEGFEGNGRTCSVPQPATPIAAPNSAQLASVAGLLLVISAVFMV